MKKLSVIILLLILLTCCVMAQREASRPDTHPATTADGESLTVHFLDVGQADCALLECGGEYLLIDGGNQEDGSLVISYLEDMGVQELTAVVCTHAHEDHVGGLPAVLAVYPTAAVYAPTRTYSSNVFDDFVYYTDQQGLTITIPEPGDALTLGDTRITVLGPVTSYAETNDTSIILKAEFGSTSFLFTGDMEVAAENDMLDYWGSRVDWNVDVLKVGHHGSDTSTGYRFLNEVMPTYGVISVGTGNTYGHPNEEPLSRLQDAGVTLFRTDYLGTVIATSDGSEVSFQWENQNAEPANAETAAPVTFIGNINSKKFHAEGCRNLPGEDNRVYFSSYEAAIEEGYTPCGSCLG